MRACRAEAEWRPMAKKGNKCPSCGAGGLIVSRCQNEKREKGGAREGKGGRGGGGG